MGARSGKKAVPERNQSPYILMNFIASRHSLHPGDEDLSPGGPALVLASTLRGCPWVHQFWSRQKRIGASGYTNSDFAVGLLDSLIPGLKTETSTPRTTACPWGPRTEGTDPCVESLIWAPGISYLGSYEPGASD
jgi:hypothetical protein